MANGREQEATEFLVKYHGNGNPDSRLVRLEIDEMKENIRQDGLDKSNWDYRPFFFTHAGRWRFAQVLMISIFGQFSGNGRSSLRTAGEKWSKLLTTNETRPRLLQHRHL